MIYRELQQRLSEQPGVLCAAQIAILPLSGSGWNDTVWADGAAPARKESFFNRVGPGNFHTIGAALMAGRDFERRDSIGAPQVAIVNELFARRILGSVNVVGRLFRREGPPGKPNPPCR